MRVGDRVIKTQGHKFEGVVVAVYATLSGDERVVVECVADGFAGWQMIFRPDLLQIVGQIGA